MVRKSKKNVRDVAVMVKEILEQHPKTRDVEEARINKTGEYIEFAQDGSI